MFKSRLFLCLAVFFIHFAGISAERCAPTTPFSDDLIGNTYCSSGECYRPGSQNCVSIYNKITVLKINNGIRFFNCPETYIIRYRNPSVTPMIIKWPPLDSPPFIRSTDENNRWCIRNQSQKRIEMFPVHSTRANFTRAVKEIVPHLLRIRDFGCELDENGYWGQIQGRAYVNADVQAVMTYLDTIAFQYAL
ncbi:unnamed protein product [Agarophyton chilense]